MNAQSADSEESVIRFYSFLEKSLMLSALEYKRYRQMS
jgi:hypothetical protein